MNWLRRLFARVAVWLGLQQAPADAAPPGAPLAAYAPATLDLIERQAYALLNVLDAVDQMALANQALTRRMRDQIATVLQQVATLR